jgi:small subunit ribosomal protein S4
MSSYGMQLREKQKAKRLFNVMEKQFRRYFEIALKKKGNTGENLITILEERLDNIVYRLGFASTRRQARQMVNHGFICVNSNVVDIPSYNVRVGDLISIKESKKESRLIKEMDESRLKHEPPKWLHSEPEKITGKLLSHPEGEDLKQVFDPTMIVELYSR